MKKYLFIIAAAATCMLAACTKEIKENVSEEIITEETPSAIEQKPGWTYIGAANIEGVPTAASVSGGTHSTFTWNTGDKIAVYSGSIYYVSDGLASAYDGTNSAVFAFEGEINAGRADFAVYPASLVHDGTAVRTGSASDHTAASLKITLPGTYTLAEVQDEVSPTPMIAVNAPGQALAFKSVCALLRITVRYIPKDAHTLRISFPGKKVCGEFTLADFVAGAKGVVLEDSAAEGDDTIIITDLGINSFTDSLVINVPVPMGVASSQEYRYVRVAAYDHFEKGGDVFDHKINSIDSPVKLTDPADAGSQPLNWAPGRKARRTVTAKLPYFTCNNKNNTKVVLAPGNLLADIKTKPTSSAVGEAENWRFAKHQYDALGDYSGNKFEAVGDSLDLFAWTGLSAAVTLSLNQYGMLYPSRKDDWNGTTAVEKLKYSWADLFNGVTYPVDTWRVPNGDKTDEETQTEMWRLTYERTGTNGYLSAKVTILDKNGTDVLARGLLLFPDNFELPYSVGEITNHAGSSGVKTAHYSDNELSFEKWDLLERVGGCAFLPVTSVRDNIKESSDNKYHLNTYRFFGDAAYWNDYSISKNNSAALIVSDIDYCQYSCIDSSNPTTNLNPGKSVGRQKGCAVRLIRNVN